VMTGGILLDLVQEMVACWPVERVIVHLQLWRSWWRVWRRLVKWIQIKNTIYYYYCEVTVLFIYYHYLADISIYWPCGGVTNINTKYNSSQAWGWDVMAGDELTRISSLLWQRATPIQSFCLLHPELYGSLDEW
jgi:hypothetical protein